ncbi:MAG TPA: redoxin domain-containing protein [Gemmataceae bacterium]|nr:redoxin domain-containing protein [Gemmataceae bacterium]
MRRLLLGAMALLLCIPLLNAKDKPKKPLLNKEAPDIAGIDFDGKKFKLSDYRGKVVVLDFWGNW